MTDDYNDKNFLESKILDDRNVIKRTTKTDSYDLDYSLLIFKALEYWWSKNNVDRDKAVKLTDELFLYAKSISDRNNDWKHLRSFEPFNKKSFLEIYPIIYKKGESKEKDRIGAIIVDRSNTCFPLVLYPIKDPNEDPKKRLKGNRIGAFYHAARSFLKNQFLDQYLALVEDPRIWGDVKKEVIKIKEQYDKRTRDEINARKQNQKKSA
jgi:hypothetical protein